jgi:hypothetical protein
MIRRCRQKSASQMQILTLQRLPGFRRLAESMLATARMLSEYPKHGTQRLVSVCCLACALAGGCAMTGDNLTSAEASQAGARPLASGRDQVTQSSYQALAPADPQPVTPAVAIESVQAAPDQSMTNVAIAGLEPMDTHRESAPILPVSNQALPTVKTPDDPPLVSALRSCLEKKPAEAVAQLAVYDKPNQDVLLCLLPLAARLSELSLDHARPDDVDAILDQVDSSMVPLRSRAGLTIEKMAFCRRIDAFGVYQPLSREHRFRPAEVAQLYIELRNFATRDKESGTHVISLASSGEIRDARGKRYPLSFDRKGPDESRTSRHDYFESYRFCIPNLAPGLYTLWIQVVDQGTEPPRKAERTLDFCVTNLPGHDG